MSQPRAELEAQCIAAGMRPVEVRMMTLQRLTACLAQHASSASADKHQTDNISSSTGTEEAVVGTHATALPQHPMSAWDSVEAAEPDAEHGVTAWETKTRTSALSTSPRSQRCGIQLPTAAESNVLVAASSAAHTSRSVWRTPIMGSTQDMMRPLGQTAPKWTQLTNPEACKPLNFLSLIKTRFDDTFDKMALGKYTMPFLNSRQDIKRSIDSIKTLQSTFIAPALMVSFLDTQDHALLSLSSTVEARAAVLALAAADTNKDQATTSSSGAVLGTTLGDETALNSLHDLFWQQSALEASLKESIECRESIIRGRLAVQDVDQASQRDLFEKSDALRELLALVDAKRRFIWNCILHIGDSHPLFAKAKAAITRQFLRPSGNSFATVR